MSFDGFDNVLASLPANGIRIGLLAFCGNGPGADEAVGTALLFDKLCQQGLSHRPPRVVAHGFEFVHEVLLYDFTIRCLGEVLIQYAYPGQPCFEGCLCILIGGMPSFKIIQDRRDFQQGMN